VEDALYSHILALKSKYVSTGDAGILLKIKQELHALTDCRALLNSLAMDLNKWMIIVTDKEKYNEFSVYVYWYENQHDDIEIMLQ